MVPAGSIPRACLDAVWRVYPVLALAVQTQNRIYSDRYMLRQLQVLCPRSGSGRTHNLPVLAAAGKLSWVNGYAIIVMPY